MLQRNLLAAIPFDAWSSHFQLRDLESKLLQIKSISPKDQHTKTKSVQAYQEVNEEFALKTIDALRQVHSRLLKEYNGNEDVMPVPVVWIHDYQLMLAAAMIRQVIIRVLTFRLLIDFRI